MSQTPTTTPNRPSRVLFVGNGIQRGESGTLSWEEVMQKLDHEYADALPLTGNAGGLWWESVEPPNPRPWRNRPEAASFSLLARFEGLAWSPARAGGPEPYRELKREVANLFQSPVRNDLHKIIDEIELDHIITTNYDFSLETTSETPHPPDNGGSSERTYSLFRKHADSRGRPVWHIHGEVARPDSILLGEQHYLNSVGRLKQYLSPWTGFASSGRTYQARSPWTQPTEEHNPKWSWVDHFLTGDVRIVGFGFDTTELDLWWLLRWRRAVELRQQQEHSDDSDPMTSPKPIPLGSIHFYECVPDGETARQTKLKHQLLRDLNVKVHARSIPPASANTQAPSPYRLFYKDVLQQIRNDWRSL